MKLHARRFLVALVAVALVSGCSATRPDDPWECALVGALGGGAAGGIAGGATSNDSSPTEDAAIGLGIGAAAGALIGYGICALLPKDEAAPPPPPPPPPPAPVAPVVRKKIVLPGVSFALNSADLAPSAKSTLDDEVVPVMAEDENFTILIEGFTDSSGAESYNQRLSERRADAVKAELVARGIDASRISSVGLGEANPIASNDTLEGRARNRRVEIKVHEN